jgi:hypothetical protein
MPNGSVPFPQSLDSLPSHPIDRRALRLRFRTRWNRKRLDDELARGADPATSPELAPGPEGDTSVRAAAA